MGTKETLTTLGATVISTVAQVLRERPPDAAHRLRRAMLALTARKVTAEAARTALRKRPK